MTAPASIQQLDDFARFVQIWEFYRLQQLDGAYAGLWQVVEVDLSTTAINTNGGQPYPVKGYGAVALRNGSNPGARVRLQLNGGNEVRNWCPGSSFKGQFESFTVQLEANSANVGKLLVLVLTSPYADYMQPKELGSLEPVALLGSRAGALYTRVAVAQNTDPTNAGANQVGAFNTSGFKRLRVTVAGSPVAGTDNFTTVDLVPWSSPDYTPAAGGTWYEQGRDRVQLPDTDTSGGAYRVFTVDVAGAGWMYFSVRNLVAASGSPTGVNLFIEGIQ